jgi:signal transduction histidine kinase
MPWSPTPPAGQPARSWGAARTMRSAGEMWALAALFLSGVAFVVVLTGADLSASFPEQAAALFTRRDRQMNLATTLTVGLSLVLAVWLACAARPRDGTTAHAALLAQEGGGSHAAVERLTSSLAARDELLLTVVHELRAPLTHVVGYAELLSSGARPRPPQEISEMSAAIQTASATMLRLMDDLVEATRLQEPGFALKTRPVDLSQVIRGMVAGYGVHSNTHRYTLDLPDHGLAVLADPERIHQVLANLLTNAINYSPAGSEIEVRARQTGDLVRVEIRDRGIGMAPEDQQRVFDRFYRAGAARSLREDGSGLGLSIVRDIVEAHGGNVGLVSRLGQGTTFWFTLQVSYEYAHAPEAARSAPQTVPAHY